MTDPGRATPDGGRAYWEGCRDRRLLICRCDDCGRWFHFPGSTCPTCWSDAVTPTEVSGLGAVYTYVVHHDGDEPYPTAVVELVEQPGLRVPSTVVDCPLEELRIDLPVELTWIEHDGQPAPAFRPRTGAPRP